MFYVSEEHVNAEKAAYSELCETDPDLLDFGMKELCDIINSYSGVSTIFGCFGHPESSKEPEQMYLTMVVSNADGEAVAKKLFHNWSQALTAYAFGPHAGASNQDATLEISRLFDPRSDDNDAVRYVWTLEIFIVGGFQHRDFARDSLIAAAKAL